MKKIIALLLCAAMIFSLAACGGSAEQTAEIPAAEEVAEEPAEKEPVEQTIFQSWDDSSPQVGDPITPQPGDTKETWDLTRAANYPADDDCTDEEFFNKWLDVEGLTTDDLDARGCKQLVLVSLRPDSECMTKTTCYQKQDDGSWLPVEGLTALRGSMGKNGLNHDREQGDETSPAGLYQIGTAFGNEEMPEGTKMPWRDITKNSEWVGVNRSKYYNTWQELDDPNLDESFEYDDGEHLCEYISAYALACVIRFNMPPYAVKYRGSAIFFHVSKGATAGCIGLKYNDFKNCLLWLDPELCPYILITGNEK